MEAAEISRTTRHLAPAHYSLKVEAFSSLSEIEKYESGVFEAGGYNWRFLFYPNGDKENDGENHISLYLEIVEIDSLPVDWQINVNFKFFVHNQREDNYLMIQDNSNGGVRRFHGMKTKWGFAQLLPLSTLTDTRNGYIVSDSCVFGAEVFVIKHSGKGESLSLVRDASISNSTFTWEIEKFSVLDQDSYNSAVFAVGGRNWYLQMYPKGNNINKEKGLGLFLCPSDWKSQVPTKAGVCVAYKFRVVDQITGNHYESQASYCFSTTDVNDFGFSKLISLKDLHDRSNGYIMKDSLTLEVEFVAVTETNYSGTLLN